MATATGSVTLEELTAAIEAVDRDAKGRKLPYAGEVPCPVCGGTITYAVRGPRAISFACLKVDCVRGIG